MSFTEKLSQLSLGQQMDLIPLLEEWCAAKRAEVFTTLMAGDPVDGYKLVTGKRGDRKFEDLKVAEEILKSARIPSDEMYKKTLITPTVAEKLLAAAKPKVWEKLKAGITQAPAGAHVAPESDTREPWVVATAENDFVDEDGSVEDLV